MTKVNIHETVTLTDKQFDALMRLWDGFCFYGTKYADFKLGRVTPSLEKKNLVLRGQLTPWGAVVLPGAVDVRCRKARAEASRKGAA